MMIARHSIHRKIMALFFLLYVAIVFAGVMHHEPGIREAQTWQLAKNSTITELLFRHMRYEGNPGLWHLLLMLPTKLGLPYKSANFMSAFCSVLSAGLIMFLSPLPFWLAAALPFTFFFVYQSGILARPYCLFPVLLFSIAHVFPSRFVRPERYFLLLGLLALVSLHGTIVAAVLALHHAIYLIWHGEGAPKDKRNKSLISYLAFGVLCVGICIELWPAPDYYFPFKGFTYGSFNFSVIYFFETVGAALNAATSESTPITIFSLIGISYFLYRGHTLALCAALIGGTLTLFSVKGYGPWHESILVFILLFSIWIADEGARFPKAGTARIILSLSLFPMLLCHLFWSYSIYRYEISNQTSESKAVAEYLERRHNDGSSIYGYGFPVTFIFPYLKDPFFENTRTLPPFLTWTRSDVYLQQIPDEIPKADLVIWGTWTKEPVPSLVGALPPLFQSSMQLEKTFIARQHWKWPEEWQEMYLIFSRKTSVMGK
ncbi:MAG: hypothetical protein ACXVCI_10025 [Bdellovibrionota bacterium]